jgi:endonuclease/exonuclease/phosphatase family metal-dependent hydrolase
MLEGSICAFQGGDRRGPTIQKQSASIVRHQDAGLEPAARADRIAGTEEAHFDATSLLSASSRLVSTHWAVHVALHAEQILATQGWR